MFPTSNLFIEEAECVQLDQDVTALTLKKTLESSWSPVAYCEFWLPLIRWIGKPKANDN